MAELLAHKKRKQQRITRLFRETKWEMNAVMLGNESSASEMGASESSEGLLIDSGTSLQHTFLAPRLALFLGVLESQWWIMALCVSRIWERKTLWGFLFSFSAGFAGRPFLRGSEIYSMMGSNVSRTTGAMDPNWCGVGSGQNTLIADNH